MTGEERKAWEEDVRWATEIVSKLIDGPPQNREYLSRAKKILAAAAELKKLRAQVEWAIDELDAYGHITAANTLRRRAGE